MQLTRRSLWGYVPRAVATPPTGSPRLALSFDLDYQADTDALPALLALLDRVEARSTLFCIGALVEQDPAPYRAAAEAGHELANHTQTHPDNPVLNPDHEFWHLSAEEMRAEIGQAQDTLERHTGQRPVGFRSPHFKDAFPLLEALRSYPEIDYFSSALASKCPCPTPFFPALAPFPGDRGLHYPGAAGAGYDKLMVPLTPSPEFRWSPFSSYTSIRRPSNPMKGAGLQTVPQWERSWAKLLERSGPAKFCSVYFDPLDVMRDAETEATFERMLTHAREAGWALLPLRAVAEAWRPLLEAAA
ncbi:MAG: polysaccharide deacetylase family protein [Opitutales bacterium]